MTGDGGGGGGGIGGGIGNLIGGIVGLSTQKNTKKYWRTLRNMLLQAEQNQPDLISKDVAPAQLRIAGEFDPSSYDAQIAGDPTTPEGDPRIRDEQLGALRYLGQVREEGLPLAERLIADEMQREVSGEAQRAQASVLRNLAERGRLSGGDEIAARILANQQATELSRGLGSDLARQAVMNRMAANDALGSLSSGVRSQDFNESASQANVLNDFNHWASNLMTQSARDNSQSQQQAGFMNVGRAQDVSDQNTYNVRDAVLENLKRENLRRQTEYGNRLSLFNPAINIYGGLAADTHATNAANMRNAQQLGKGIGSILSKKP